MAPQRLPLSDERGGLVGAIVMRIVDMLDDGLAGVEFVAIRNVVEKEKQFIGCCRQRLILFCDGWGILRGVTRASGGGAVHADAIVIGAVPLAPAVSLRGFHVW